MGKSSALSGLVRKKEKRKKNVNSQSKFHSRKGVELTMRNERNEDKEQERKGQKTKEKEQES